MADLPTALSKHRRRVVAMNSDIAIHVEGLWKRYGPGTGPVWRRLVATASSWVTANREAVGDDSGPWALRDISFEVKRGETLGIVGRNGAGKSTLLKLLAGVTQPSRGHVAVSGQVFPMIELNAGIHYELTGRENVFLLGAIMGLPRRDVQTILPDIEEFVELGEWFDRPARTYSSGMLARLGFGVATSIRSDILLIDETFSVGDLKFQNKSLARVKEMRESGATIVLVSHNLDVLQHVARRGIVLDQGKIVMQGSIAQGLSHYERSVFSSEQLRLEAKSQRRATNELLTISRAHIYGEGGRVLTEVAAGEGFGLEIEFRVHRPVERPVWSIGILNSAGVVCAWNVSVEDGFSCQRIEGGYRLRLWYQENRLVPGAYECNFALRDGSSYETIDRVASIASFFISKPGRARGVVLMSPTWELSEHPPDSKMNGRERGSSLKKLDDEPFRRANPTVLP